MTLYPLKFRPRFVEKMWGGRKIETVLGKSLPPGKQIGESWELYDFPPGVVDGSAGWVSAVVANGPLAGRTIHDLVTEFGRDLTGDVALVGPGQFPILIKFLDAREDLSVQVHPPQVYADKNPGAHLKTEAWYIMENDPGARLFKGLRPGVTRSAFGDAVRKGTCEQHLTSIPVEAGQCYYLPSGTVHALGAGMLVAEVQTPSDTTFRVFDFNRVDPSTGQQRALHVEQALECIDFSGKPEPESAGSHVGGVFANVSRLVVSPFFRIEKVRLGPGAEESVHYDEPVVWIMLEGEAEIGLKDLKEPVDFKTGQTLLLPARMSEPRLKTKSACVWLQVTFPTTIAE